MDHLHGPEMCFGILLRYKMGNILWQPRLDEHPGICSTKKLDMDGCTKSKICNDI